MRDLRIIQAVVILVGVWLPVGAAQSAPESSTAVQATVVASCITSATPGEFKPSNVASDAGQQNGVGTVSITCKRGLPYHVDVSYRGISMRAHISLAAKGTSTAQNVRIYAQVVPRRIASGPVVSDVSRPRAAIGEDSVIVSVTF